MTMRKVSIITAFRLCWLACIGSIKHVLDAMTSEIAKAKSDHQQFVSKTDANVKLLQNQVNLNYLPEQLKDHNG